MNSTLKSVLFTVLGVVIFLAIASFFISLIPYLLIAGVVIFIVVKLKKVFSKNNTSKSTEYTNYYTNIRTEEAFTKTEDTYTGKVIDVDYKEVDK